MAKTYSDQVYKGRLPNGIGKVVTTVAANTTFILKGFFIVNLESTDRAAALNLDEDIPLLALMKPIPSGETLIRSNLNIPILTDGTIRVCGATDSTKADLLMYYYIWGVNEVDS